MLDNFLSKRSRVFATLFPKDKGSVSLVITEAHVGCRDDLGLDWQTGRLECTPQFLP